MSLDFLLEIGTEEIPHWMIPGAMKQLAETGSTGRDSARRRDAAPSCGAGVHGLPERTPDQEQIVNGPPRLGSSGDKGRPPDSPRNKAWTSCAASRRRIIMSCTRRCRAAPSVEILAESLPAAILGFQWPKTMYWTGEERAALYPADSLDRCASRRPK